MFGAESSHLVGRTLDSLVAPANEARRPARRRPEALRYETTGRATTGAPSRPRSRCRASSSTASRRRWRSWPTSAGAYEAEELRDRFIGVLSHELRTPITSIFGGAQVLLRRGTGLDSSTRDELLGQVAGEAERLERMVENLLILARVERGADVVDVSPVLLHRIVPAVVAREQGTWPSMT